MASEWGIKGKKIMSTFGIQLQIKIIPRKNIKQDNNKIYKVNEQKIVQKKMKNVLLIRTS